MNAHWPAPPMETSRFFKIVVSFEPRPDGGLRAWSDMLPGFVLSHGDVDKLLADVKPALEAILSARLGKCMIASPLDDLHLQLEDGGLVDSLAPQFFEKKEYVAHDC